MPESLSVEELESPDAAESAFYGAFARLDSGAMERVWADGDGVVCVHPGGGLLAGKVAVMQSWIEILSGVAPPRIEHRLLRRMAGPDLCVHLVEESIRAGGEPDGAPNLVLATNVYVREEKGWRLYAHHASLPLLVPRAGPQRERQLH